MTHAAHVGVQDSQSHTLRTPFTSPSKTPYTRPLSEATEIYETDLEDDESLFEENSPKPSFGSVSNGFTTFTYSRTDLAPVRQQKKERNHDFIFRRGFDAPF